MKEGLSFITKLQYLTNVVGLLSHKIHVTVSFSHDTGLCSKPPFVPIAKTEAFSSSSSLVCVLTVSPPPSSKMMYSPSITIFYRILSIELSCRTLKIPKLTPCQEVGTAFIQEKQLQVMLALLCSAGGWVVTMVVVVGMAGGKAVSGRFLETWCLVAGWWWWC